MHHAPCSVHHALCTVHRAPCTMRHATCTYVLAAVHEKKPDSKALLHTNGVSQEQRFESVRAVMGWEPRFSCLAVKYHPLTAVTEYQQGVAFPGIRPKMTRTGDTPFIGAAVLAPEAVRKWIDCLRSAPTGCAAPTAPPAHLREARCPAAQSLNATAPGAGVQRIGQSQEWVRHADAVTLMIVQDADR
jgi:hypothetical protein